MIQTARRILITICISLSFLSGSAQNSEGKLSCTDYSKADTWYEIKQAIDKSMTTEADIFYLYPTVAMKGFTDNHESWNTRLPLDADVQKGANANQRFNKMLYKDYAFYAPYYRQCIMSTFMQQADVQAVADSIAVSDVTAAFREYITHYNHGRPFFLVGHSQGSRMLLEILKNAMTDAEYSRMVAAYLIGYGVTESDLSAHADRIVPAEGADDLGRVIVFNSVTRTDAISPLLVRSAIGINPITWTVTDTHAGKEMHQGLAKYNADRSEIIFDEHLTGGYLCNGVMVCTDLADDYCFQPSLKEAFPLGNLHFADSFLYGKDVRENMKVRLKKYLMNQK